MEQHKEKQKLVWESEKKFLAFLTADKLDIDQFTWKWFVNMPNDLIKYISIILYYGFLSKSLHNLKSNYLETLTYLNERNFEWVIKINRKNNFNYYTLNKLALNEAVEYLIAIVQNYFFSNSVKHRNGIKDYVCILRSGKLFYNTPNEFQKKEMIFQILKLNGLTGKMRKITPKGIEFLELFDRLEQLKELLIKRTEISNRFPEYISDEIKSKQLKIPILHFPLQD